MPTGLRDWHDLMIRDHGFLRLFWHNLYPVKLRHSDKPIQVWRSNQPTPKRIRKAVNQLGIRTLISLRGERHDGVGRLESEAASQAGIAFEQISIYSRAVPDKETIREAHALFKRAEYPILIHCKSGADRAGIMSALYLLLIENASPEEASEQLSFKYLHVKQAKTGILDAFLASYASAAKKGVPFLRWLEDDFDPDAITKNFKAKGWADRLVDNVLRRE